MHKNFTKTLLASVLFFALISINVYSEDATKEIQIQTNAHCGGCKNKIEKGLKKMDGILKSEVNLENKIVTISYNPSKISEEKINNTIADMGYSSSIIKDDDCSHDHSSVKDASNKKDCRSKSDCCKSKKTDKTKEVKENESK